MARREIGAKPQGGGGDDRILDWQGKDRVRVRVLEPFVEEWRQYTLRAKMQEDAETVRFVVARNGDPLARKGFKSTARSAVNVWDYETNSVKILMGGPQVFKALDEMREAGFDPCASDIVISKTGKGRDTKYSVNRMDKAPAEFTFDQSDLHDLSMFDRPPSNEELFRILKELEIDYDAIKLPEFTLAEAMEYKLPFGKHRDRTLADLLANEADYLDYMVRRMEESGDVGRDTYIAMKTVLTDGNYDPYEGMPRAADFVNGDTRATTTPPPAASPSPEPAQAAPAPVDDDGDDDEPEDAPPAATPPASTDAPARITFTDDDVKGATSFANWLKANGFSSFTPEKGDDGKWGGVYEGEDDDITLGGYASRRDLLTSLAGQLCAQANGEEQGDGAEESEASEPADEAPATPPASTNGKSDDDLREEIKAAFKQSPFSEDFSLIMKILEEHADGVFNLDEVQRPQLDAIAAAIATS